MPKPAIHSRTYSQLLPEQQGVFKLRDRIGTDRFVQPG